MIDSTCEGKCCWS